MPTFIFKTGGNWQTVKMSESISQSLTSTESSEVCDAVESERRFVRVRPALCSLVRLCVSEETAGGMRGTNFLHVFFFFLFKIAGEDVDCNHLWCLSENNTTGTRRFL